MLGSDQKARLPNDCLLDLINMLIHQQHTHTHITDTETLESFRFPFFVVLINTPRLGHT